MPLPASSRPLLIRVASALRRAGAALARLARSPVPGRPDRAAGTLPAGERADAVPSRVQDALPGSSTAPAAPASGAEAPRAGLRARLRRLEALLEPLRRHEDVVLVVALLVGIAMMILHWVP